MTNTVAKTSADGTGALTGIPVDDVIAAARELARGGRWHRAARLLDATTAAGPQARALLALAAAEVALEGDRFCGTSAANGRLNIAEEACATADLDPGSRWDLAFLWLRHGYFDQVLSAGGFYPGPEGKDPDVVADLRRRAGELRGLAPDDVRRGWAEMYLGLIADNLYGQRDVAPAHYQAALGAGESGDDLLAREALRHLGDHGPVPRPLRLVADRRSRSRARRPAYRRAPWRWPA